MLYSKFPDLSTLTDMHLVRQSALCKAKTAKPPAFEAQKKRNITINRGADFTFGMDSTFCYVPDRDCACLLMMR
jgi:hypothetical protein